MLLGCCCPGCVVFSDNFARENLGEDWVVESGTAAITDDQLVLSGTDALVRAVAEADTQAMRVTTQAKGSAGAKLRVIVAMLDDDNYLYGELEINDGGDGSISLWKVDSGVTEQLGDSVEVDAAADTLHEIVVCFDPGDPGHLRIDALGEFVSEGVDGFGNHSGLGGVGTFDDFELTNGLSDTNPECPECSRPAVDCVPCEDDSGPRDFVITIPPGEPAGDSGCTQEECDDMEGSYVISWGDQDLVPPGGCRWDGTFPHESFECTVRFVNISVFPESEGKVKVRVEVRNGTTMPAQVTTYERDFDAPLNCLDMQNEEIPFESADSTVCFSPHVVMSSL